MILPVSEPQGFRGSVSRNNTPSSWQRCSCRTGQAESSIAKHWPPLEQLCGGRIPGVPGHIEGIPRCAARSRSSCQKQSRARNADPWAVNQFRSIPPGSQQVHSWLVIVSASKANLSSSSGGGVEGCGGVWRGVEGCGGRWREVEGGGGRWREVEGWG